MGPTWLDGLPRWVVATVRSPAVLAVAVQAAIIFPVLLIVIVIVVLVILEHLGAIARKSRSPLARANLATPTSTQSDGRSPLAPFPLPAHHERADTPAALDVVGEAGWQGGAADDGLVVRDSEACEERAKELDERVEHVRDRRGRRAARNALVRRGRARRSRADRKSVV